MPRQPSSVPDQTANPSPTPAPTAQTPVPGRTPELTLPLDVLKDTSQDITNNTHPLTRQVLKPTNRCYLSQEAPLHSATSQMHDSCACWPNVGSSLSSCSTSSTVLDLDQTPTSTRTYTAIRWV
ncbi:hypothetical protein CTheo_4191 [Ceratobasidium theobromae]|uniref:Uncharacterized protein n=1 Tax=Ceratobasidium theobromae TaxID=1582974 RepID=A0A5N5QM76_9AGAM|nr:hypothetical protein CTheo_4191 [Ceratobasidium theobromae]